MTSLSSDLVQSSRRDWRAVPQSSILMAEGEENLSKTLDQEMPPATEDLPSDDSDSDSDSEEEADEAADALRVQALQQALRNQPLHYDSHLQYINCLRKLGEIDKLRNAREHMNRLFPLSPNLWQDWIADEVSLKLNQGAEAFSEIEQLYERAVQEYLSVPLWCDYINFVQEHDKLVSQCSPGGVTKMRELLERAITAAGFHVSEGSKIWEAYREYEQALLLTIDEENTKDRIRSLFHRQLAVPLENLRTTLMDYKAWEADQGNSNDMDAELDGVPPNVALNYQKASAAYNARKQYEDQLTSPVQSEADKLQHFLNYIKFEESSGDPTRVQILYERAISELPVSSDLWLGYTNYLDKTLKVASILKSVYYRATRNCPWISELWVRYLLSLERTKSSEEEIRSVFEQSLQCAFQTKKESLDLYLTRIDGLRRRFSLDQEDFDFQLIRQAFMDASDLLSKELSPEELLSLHKYWAKLEINLGKDITAARGVWDNLIKKSGSTLESHQGYIAMEVEMGHINEARAIYKRCYAKRFARTGSEDICHAWLKFEREHGTLEDYDVALKKVTARLNEVMLFKAQQESKGKADHSAVSVKESTNSPLKRKTDQKPNMKVQPPAKRRRQDAPKTQEKFEPDLGKMEIESEEQLQKEEEKGKEIKKPKAEFYDDQCTAFISNLNLRTNEEDLKYFFSDCGGVTAVRLVRDKVTGKSRGYAYVDFSDDQHLQAAIAKNKKTLHGAKLSIARSDPSRSKKSRPGMSGSFRGRGTARNFPPRNESKSSEEGRNPSKEEPSTDTGASGKEKKVTFMAPRSVMKPLGWNKKDGEGKVEVSGGAELKSNEEFRNLFLKK
ncbi:Squamous cell carcinoma antigen recognized by T-cells 3 [Rhynchospora pubera]|uniref:Squamous cell carcinoma antigen recognized by T-cells 3 n=1 Tax=Rhynchospora pubera TaxID=906938 RepID=A0AAV8EY40_9POAL|nr:Squamous cell carcinoma antigen recognized by T-cells 3 [Rhynchospora pubera]